MEDDTGLLFVIERVVIFIIAISCLIGWAFW